MGEEIVINNGSISINYFNVIVLGLIIICGIAISAYDTMNNNQSIPAAILQSNSVGSVSLSEHLLTNYNVTDSTTVPPNAVAMILFVVVMVLIAVSMFFMRSFA